MPARGGKPPVAERLAPYIDAQVGANMVTRAQALGLDSGKLARLVAELNDNHSRGNAYAAHALLRALLDHIPPLLGCRDFTMAAREDADLYRRRAVVFR